MNVFRKPELLGKVDGFVFAICLHTESTTRNASHLGAVKTFVYVCFQGVRSNGLAKRDGDANANSPPGYEIGSNLEFHSVSPASHWRPGQFNIGSKQPLLVKIAHYAYESHG